MVAIFSNQSIWLAQTMNVSWNQTKTWLGHLCFVILPLFWQPCFSTNQYGLSQYVTRSLKEHLYKIILELDKRIQWRRILQFRHLTPFLLPQQQINKYFIIHIFEKNWKWTTKGTFLWSFVDISQWIKMRYHLKLKDKFSFFW